MFDASGILVRVLEQREKGELNGKGWHEGGCFGNRDGHHRDTVAVSALPATIPSYFTTNYPKDTLNMRLLTVTTAMWLLVWSVVYLSLLLPVQVLL